MFVIIPSSIRDVIDHITLMRRANRTVDRGVESVPSEDLPWMDPRGQLGGSSDEHASRRQRSERDQRDHCKRYNWLGDDWHRDRDARPVRPSKDSADDDSESRAGTDDEEACREHRDLADTVEVCDVVGDRDRAARVADSGGEIILGDSLREVEQKLGLFGFDLKTLSGGWRQPHHIAVRAHVIEWQHRLTDDPHPALSGAGDDDFLPHVKPEAVRGHGTEDHLVVRLWCAPTKDGDSDRASNGVDDQPSARRLPRGAAGLSECG